MNELMLFSNPEFGQVRTLEEKDKILFCAKDVAISLGYKDPTNAIKLHCKGVVKRHLLTGGGKQLTNFIPEGDIYRLAASSELPGADRFESWIFDEVLPSIRKTGAYITDPNKAALAEAKLNNSRARVASMWMRVADVVPLSEFKQICASYASEALAGKPVLPLPEVAGYTYTAEEVGAMLGGLSGNKVGRIANQYGLKVPEYAVEVWDKSRHSNKQVPAWRYNDKAVERFREILSL